MLLWNFLESLPVFSDSIWVEHPNLSRETGFLSFLIRDSLARETQETQLPFGEVVVKTPSISDHGEILIKFTSRWRQCSHSLIDALFGSLSKFKELLVLNSRSLWCGHLGNKRILASSLDTWTYLLVRSCQSRHAWRCATTRHCKQVKLTIAWRSYS